MINLFYSKNFFLILTSILFFEGKAWADRCTVRGAGFVQAAYNSDLAIEDISSELCYSRAQTWLNYIRAQVAQPLPDTAHVIAYFHTGSVLNLNPSNVIASKAVPDGCQISLPKTMCKNGAVTHSLPLVFIDSEIVYNTVEKCNARAYEWHKYCGADTPYGNNDVVKADYYEDGIIKSSVSQTTHANGCYVTLPKCNVSGQKLGTFLDFPGYNNESSCASRATDWYNYCGGESYMRDTVVKSQFYVNGVLSANFSGTKTLSDGCWITLPNTTCKNGSNTYVLPLFFKDTTYTTVEACSARAEAWRNFCSVATPYVNTDVVRADFYSGGVSKPAVYPFDLKDFLVQDVCYNNGQVIAEDPATCANHRDLKPGEALPYRRSDFLNSNGYRSDILVTSAAQAANLESTAIGYGAQFWDSLDIGNGFFVSTMNSLSTPNLMSQAASQDFNPWGLNVMRIDSSPINNKTWVSIIATRDALTPNKSGVAYFAGAGCVNEKSWILFPSNSADLSLNQTLNENWKVSSFEPGFGSDFSSCLSYQIVNGTHTVERKLFEYTSSKTLDSIITKHIAFNSVLDEIAQETIYFTKEYGMTRWEAWTNLNKPVTGNLMCNGSDTSDGQAVNPTNFNQLKRTGCRDLTKLYLINVAGQNDKYWAHPQSLFNLNEFPQNRQNLILNSDFQDTFVNGTGTLDFGKWRKVNASNGASLSWSIEKDLINARWLTFSYTGSDAPKAEIDGDLSKIPANGFIGVGATFTMLEYDANGTLTRPLLVSAVQLDSSGLPISGAEVVSEEISIKIPYNAENSARYFFRKKIQKHSNAVRLRMTLTPLVAGKSYQVTMPYISLAN